MNVLPYNDADIDSIVNWGKNLEEKTFREIAPKEYRLTQGNKGNLGHVIEKYHFRYEINSVQDADFPKVGVELKTFAAILKEKGWTAKERLVLTMIDFARKQPEDIENSDLIHKIAKILMVIYQWEKNKDKLDFTIMKVFLFLLHDERFAADLQIIKADYRKIIEMMNSGRAHELSESLTEYLGACTKGSTAEKSLRQQFANPGVLARGRAFSLKQSYVSSLLRRILDLPETGAPIASVEELAQKNLSQIVLERLNEFVGMKQSEMCKLLEVSSHAKNLRNILVMRALQVHAEEATEFQNAGITVKTIYVKPDGKMQEQMSFPKIKFSDFIADDWVNSQTRDFFENVRFLFVTFGGDKNDPVFLGAKFWSMPAADIDGALREDWEKCVTAIKHGGELKLNEHGRVTNNLPGIKDTSIIHLRPKAPKSAYRIYNEDGELIYSRGLKSHADLLPNGNMMTSQCYWLNKDYLEDQLNLAEMLKQLSDS